MTARSRFIFPDPTKAPPENPHAGGDPLIRVLVWTFLYGVPLTIALIHNLDFDIWWHLRVGQWIVEQGTVPVTDPFSQFGLASGKAWFAYSWLYEVLVWSLYRIAGPTGLFLGRAVLTLLIFVAVHVLIAKRVRHFPTAAALFALTALAMLPLITDRPWLFTILFCALILDILLDLRAGQPARRMWLLPILFVLWAKMPVAMDGRTNLHTDARIARHLDVWMGKPGWEDDPELSAAGVIIAEVWPPLTALLRHDDRFRVAYEDEVAVVFLRR